MISFEGNVIYSVPYKPTKKNAPRTTLKKIEDTVETVHIHSEPFDDFISKKMLIRGWFKVHQLVLTGIFVLALDQIIQKLNLVKSMRFDETQESMDTRVAVRGFL